MARAIQVENLLSGLIDASGDPLSGGKVWTYEAGTSTLKNTYTDQAMSANSTNPIILDSRGKATVFGYGNYKFKVYNSADVLQDTIDNLIYAYPDDTTIYCGTSSGAANAYVVTPSPALSSLTDGLTLTFIANFASTGACTINPSGLGVYNLVRSDGSTALGVGDTLVNMICDVRYVLASNHFRLVSQSGVLALSSGGTGSSTASGARANLSAAVLGANNDITSMSVVTLAGNTTTNLDLKCGTGFGIAFYNNATIKCHIPAGTSSGDPGFVPWTDDTFTLGTSAKCWQLIYTKGILGRGANNLTIASAATRSIEMKAGNGTAHWTFSPAGQLVQTAAPAYSFFAFSTTRSLNPAAATAVTCADAINTIAADLVTAGIFKL
jgi:hypothetical protein